jgi:hypothetical protein
MFLIIYTLHFLNKSMYLYLKKCEPWGGVNAPFAPLKYALVCGPFQMHWTGGDCEQRILLLLRVTTSYKNQDLGNYVLQLV